MARNEEKQLGRLNRLYLKNLKDEQEKKNPKRPRLIQIRSAVEIKQWLPSIKKDIDFYIKQSQVPCYPESKIKEFHQKIDHLQGEYKAFVRKLRQLDPNIKEIPWVDRKYRKVSGSLSSESRIPYLETDDMDQPDQKNVENSSTSCILSDTENRTGCSCDKLNYETSEGKNPDTNIGHKNQEYTESKEFVPIATPILEKDSKYKNFYGYGHSNTCLIETSQVDSELQDKPLTFEARCSSPSGAVQLSHSKGHNSLQTLLPYSDSSDED